MLHSIIWVIVQNIIIMLAPLKTYLDNLVPSSADNDGVLGVGAEPDARNPFSVTLLGDCVFAVAESVPELDGSVARS